MLLYQAVLAVRGESVSLQNWEIRVNLAKLQGGRRLSHRKAIAFQWLG